MIWYLTPWRCCWPVFSFWRVLVFFPVPASSTFWGIGGRVVGVDDGERLGFGKDLIKVERTQGSMTLVVGYIVIGAIAGGLVVLGGRVEVLEEGVFVLGQGGWGNVCFV